MIDPTTLQVIGGAIMAVAYGGWKMWQKISSTKKEVVQDVAKANPCVTCIKEKEVDSLATEFRLFKEFVENRLDEQGEKIDTVGKDVSFVRGILEGMFLGKSSDRKGRV